MNRSITAEFAGLKIGISSRSEFMERFCRDYLSAGEPLFSVSATDDAVREELCHATEPVTQDYAEALCIYREIAERLPLYDRAVFHGAALEYKGLAYIFTAPSGTGKTTHIRLWRHYLGEAVRVINGDKPILSLSDGAVRVHGTPYAGKEGWQSNISAPLGGICFISRGKDNETARVLPKDAFSGLYLQTYKPYGEEAMVRTLGFVRSLCLAPCCTLSCDISENAVKASFEALINGNYREKKI